MVIVELVDGASPIDGSTIELFLDGVKLPVTATKSGDVSVIASVPQTLYAAGSLHSVLLSYVEAGALKTSSWNFQVDSYVGPTGNIYETMLVPGGITWLDAKIAAEQRTFLGRAGHLATITSYEEDLYLEFRRQEASVPGYGELWVGGYQIPGSEEPGGGWVWLNNEGSIPGTNEGTVHANWKPSQPDNWLEGGSTGYSHDRLGQLHRLEGFLPWRH